MADEKLIFPIGFDLEEGVKKAGRDWKNHYRKRLQDAMDSRPLKVKIDFESKGIDTKEFKQWMALSREAEKLERERIKNAKEWQKVADQQAMAETRRANATNESNARIERQNRKSEASERRKRDAVERTNEAYKRQGGYLQRLFQRMVAYASVTQAFSFIRNIREVTAEFELQRVALGSIIGDLNEANAMFEQIKAAAVKSPFQIKELVTYTKQLAAYKIESDELFETTQRLADISAGLGVGMERLVLAYGQIRATGYLRASEVRQLTEAGIPIVEELAKKMSELRGETVSAAEVMGMISERAISFGMVKEVFDDMTSAGGMFYKMQEKQAETLAGQWSNLQDSIAIMYEEIGNTEGVNNSIKGTIGLVKSLAENWRVVGDVAVWSVSAALGYAKVIKPISELVKKQDLLKKSSEAYAKSREALHLFMQTGDKDYQREYQWQLRIARSYRQSANAARGFGGALKSIGSFIKANWVGMLITAVAALVSWLISARQEANRLNKELAKIDTEGALQADQSVRNFERLAKTIRESADGSREQSEALAELKHTYGDLLPSQDKEILALVKVKEGYEDVTTAIREKINAQIYEQKMNTIISEYGTNLANKQKKPKNWLENMGFSAEETTRIFNAIDKAVQEGLIKAGDTTVEGARKLEKIIKEQTGKFISLTQTVANVDYSSGMYLGDYETTTRLAQGLFELTDVYSDFNNSVNELADSQKRASNITWEYQKGYDELKDSIAKTNEEFDVSTFAGDQAIKTNTLEKWRKYFISLSDIFAKTPEGGIVDFKALEDEIEKLPANLRAHIQVVQKEYEKLIPTDITRLANDKLQEYADKVGISMDDVKEYLKTNEQSTEDWAKGLKGAYESVEKKLAEYKKNQEAFSKQGAPFKDWSEEIEETTKEMKVLKLLMDFFKEFLPQSEKTNPRIARLKDELSTVEKIYKEYQQLSKYGEEYANKTIAQMFQGVDLKYLQMATSPEKMRKVLEDALRMAKLEGDKELALEIQYKLGKFDVDEEQRKLEKSLKDLSDQISRTKTAKEFFDRMLGMTGDKELSATLTMSVYGTTGDDLQKLMSKQILDAFKGVDISEAMLGGNKWDYNVLASFVEQLPKEQQQNAQSIVDNWRKANADILTDLQKSYEDFMTYEERKTRVAEKYVAERKKIEESQYTKDEKDKLLRASREAEKKELGAIAIEEFKASDDWIKSFEDLENLATPTIERLMAKLKEFITLNKEALTPEQLKSLMGEYDKLYNGLITRNPIQAITDSLKEYKTAMQGVKLAQDALDAAKAMGDEDLIAFAERGLTDAFDDAQKATSKLQKGLSGLSDKFSQAQQFVSSFADTLGISEDTEFGAFLNGISDALGGVSKAFSFAILAVQLFDGSIKAMLASNPIGWILLAVSAIISAVQAIANARVKRIDQDIERLEDRLDSLSYAYDRLQKAQEKAFGTDYLRNYQQQLENLEAQQEAYLKQADLERSKGKKADEEKIKEYENQARDTADAIKDMYGSLSENFLGTDLTSAARDFAQAWIEAYKEFANTTDAMKQKFQDMIQNMVVESLLAKVMEKALDPVFTMIDNMQDTDFYSTSFWNDVMSTMQTATENSTVGAQNVMSMLEQMGINLRGLGGDMTGISRDIATASEESILGLAAGINTQNFYISQVPTKLDTIIGLLRGDGAMPQGSAITLQDVMIAQNQFLSHLPTIAQHTAETVAECKQIVAETRRTADALERVIKPDGTRTTYKMNVVTTYQG